MKPIILGLLLPLLCGVSSWDSPAFSTAKDLPVQAKKDNGVVIRVEVEFGRKSRGCTDLGICRIDSGASLQGELEGNRAVADLTAENGHITNIMFIHSSLNFGTIKYFFSGDRFVVGENFSTVITHAGKQYSVTIKAGKYKLEKTPLGWSWGMSQT